MRRPPPIVATALAAALGVAGCGGGGGKASTPASTAKAGGPASPCRRVPQPAPHAAPHLKRPTLRLSPTKRWTATVRTNCGTFAIRLDVSRAPKTSGSFAFLASRHFFDGLVFHRIAPGFVIQGGDPLASGQGGPGYRVVERPPRGVRYTRGVVAMAKTDTDPAGASGSQFYVVTAEDAQLPPIYAALGKVVLGQAVVDRIGALPVKNPQDPNGGPPVQPVVIEKLTVAGA